MQSAFLLCDIHSVKEVVFHFRLGWLQVVALNKGNTCLPETAEHAGILHHGSYTGDFIFVELFYPVGESRVCFTIQIDIVQICLIQFYQIRFILIAQLFGGFGQSEMFDTDFAANLADTVDKLGRGSLIGLNVCFTDLQTNQFGRYFGFSQGLPEPVEHLL